MNSTIRNLILCAVAAVPCVAVLQAATPTTTASLTQEDTAAEFRAKFRDALKIGDAAQIAQLVKRYQIDAVDFIAETCTRISEGTSETLEREIAALAAGWRTSMKGEFANRYYEYLSLISPPERRERQRLMREFNASLGQFFANLESKDGPTFEILADKFGAYAAAFTSIGDHYMAALSWMNQGYCFEDNVRSRKEKQPTKVIQGFAKAMASMDRIDLKYARYHELKDRVETLAGDGWKEVLDNPDAPKPGEPKVAGDPVAVDMSFEAIKKLDSFERPNYMADELYQMWNGLSFSAEANSEATFAIEGSPRIVRTSAAGLELYSDGDGDPDGEIKITGKFTVTETELHEGGKRGWAFLSVTGIENDTYQGLQLNLAPAEFMSLYYMNAASVVGTYNGQELRILDDNFDGIYGSYAGHWEYVGLSPGNLHPTVDALLIGEKTKRALPWSNYQKLGDSWVTMHTEGGGTKLVITPMEIETGTLKLDYDGPDPSWVIVQGLEHLEWSYFDLLQNGKGKSVEVPAGSYQLKVGELRKGKKAQTQKALMIAGKDTPIWDVRPGEETVVELGKPYDFDFKTTTSGDGVTVVGHTVTIIGKADERYERTWNCVPVPTVSVREVGEKRGSRPESMDKVLDMLEIGDDGQPVYSYVDTWHPLDFTTELPGEDYEVQLVEKKNKLFGKIESTWK